jgi:hypothetical protein
MIDARLSSVARASPGTYSAIPGASRSGAIGRAMPRTAASPTSPKARWSEATWNTPRGSSSGCATTYCPKPKLENWLADTTRTVATDTSPTTSGAMRWVRRRVPTTPTKRAPTLVTTVQTAPRTALVASDDTALPPARRHGT